MASNRTVINLTRDYFVRLKHAKRAVEECACAWVEYGVSIRDLTLAESIVARNKQAELRDPLEYAELPGLVFRGPVGGAAAAGESRRLVREAHRFVEAA
jgi:hypothetical protein